jgi:hypothetical protein
MEVTRFALFYYGSCSVEDPGRIPTAGKEEVLS